MIVLGIVSIILATVSALLAFKVLRLHREVAVCDHLREMLEVETERSRRYKEELDRHEVNSREAEKMNDILSPLRDRIESFNHYYNESRVKDAAVRQKLFDHLDRLMSLNVTLGHEARSLTEALKGNSKIQGDWGETVLQRLLESAGFREGLNYISQMTRDEGGEVLQSERGGRLRPDIVLLLPEGRRLVIDSKVSLTDYVRMSESEDAAGREEYRKRHLLSVKRHIDELSVKRYDKVVKGSAEHVLMFMPVEGAFLEAFGSDSQLWDYAFKRRVVIVSPAHLTAILHLTSELWRQEKQSANSEEIARQAGLLYDRFVLFAKDFLKIRSSLDNSIRAYEDCEKRLSKGHLSLTARAEKLRNLGAKTQSRLPETLLPPESSPEESGSLEIESERDSEIPVA